MKVLRLVLAVSLVLGALALAGCQAIAEKAAETATEKALEAGTGNKVDIKDEGVTIEGEDGSTTSISQSGEVPKDWPSDVPVYEGTIKASASGAQSGAGDQGYVISLVTPDTPADVVAWYAKELTAEGWTKESEASVPDGAVYAAKKGARAVNVIAAGGGTDPDGATTVTITATGK